MLLQLQQSLTHAVVILDTAPGTMPGREFFAKAMIGMKGFQFRAGESVAEVRERGNKELEISVPVRTTGPGR